MESIEKLDKSVQMPVLKKIVQLAEKPEIGKELSNRLKGSRSVHVGAFRIVYVIEKDTVIIAKVGHRKDVYD